MDQVIVFINGRVIDQLGVIANIPDHLELLEHLNRVLLIDLDPLFEVLVGLNLQLLNLHGLVEGLLGIERLMDHAIVANDIEFHDRWVQEESALDDLVIDREVYFFLCE